MAKPTEMTAGSRERALPTRGPRTTLRVPEDLAETARRLAQELGTSRNDALVRLAARGAELYERESRIASRREERWAAIVGDLAHLERAEFPPQHEARDAARTFRRTMLEPDDEE